MIRGNCDLLKLTVNRTKLKCANKSFDLYKSAGPDLTLQQGIDVLSSLLCSMFRASLALGYILTAWTKARVTFIQKPRKPSYTEAKAYSPICISTFL